MNVIVKVIGIKVVKKTIEKALKKIDTELKDAVTTAAIKVEGDAKKICPVVTGRLRSSITHEVKKSGKGYIGKVGSNVEYAPRVELGIGQKKQPYLYPALQKNFAFIKKTVPGAIVEGFKR